MGNTTKHMAGNGTSRKSHGTRVELPVQKTNEDAPFTGTEGKAVR